MTANIEYTPPDVLREAQNAGLQQMIERAMRVEFYRQRLASHGIDSATLTVDDLPRLPCTHKEDLRSHYPYGLWACRREDVVEIHASSGTTGKPTVVGYTAADLRTWKLAMARTLTAVGVTPDDVVQNAYGYGCAVGELEKAKGLRVVVMAGAGTSFCTGIDLHALATGEIRIEWFRLWEDTLRRLEMLEAITIAKLHGYVLGGGLQIALACDLRVATDTSKHRLPAVLEALIPGSGTWRLPRFIGLGRARRMVLTGELMDAPEAQRIGLLDWVVPESELDATVARLTEQLLKGARTAQGLSKRLVTASFHTSFEEVREMYLEYQARVLAAPEHRVAMDEYLQMQAKRHQEKQP